MKRLFFGVEAIAKRVMSVIPTVSLERLIGSLRSNLAEGDIIAIDGKTLRGNRGWNEEDRPLHLLHAWSVEQGICICIYL